VKGYIDFSFFIKKSSLNFVVGILTRVVSLIVKLKKKKKKKKKKKNLIYLSRCCN
jgi:hypothetical protein